MSPEFDRITWIEEERIISRYGATGRNGFLTTEHSEYTKEQFFAENHIYFSFRNGVFVSF